MDKIKILFVIISVFLLIGATGCQPTKTKKGEGREISYYGKEGLVVSFIEGMPPGNVWKDMNFDVGLDVQNMGLVDVIRGYACFSSMTTELFDKADSCMDLTSEGGPLMGRLNFPDGEIRSYIQSGYSLTKSYREDVEYPLIAKVCYVGETIASPIVCIKSVGREMESVCEGGDIALGDGGKGQGGPVAVTSVYEDIVPKKGGGVDLRFEITVANVGGGEIIDESKLNDKCSFGRMEKNKVVLVAYLVGYDNALDCKESNNKIVNLGQSDEGTVLCKGSVNVEEGESFPLPLNIKLNYGYLSTTSGGFTIKKDINEDNNRED